MSISSALFSGVSGLNANSTAMTVIGNNIANTNTSGYKASDTTFSDVISQSSDVGRGTQLNSISTSFEQGSLESTTSVTDLGLEGDGFFIVNDGNSSYYTRDGRFSFDKDRYIVNSNGLKLQGWAADSNGNATGALQDLQFSAGDVPPNQTSSISVTANLDSRVTAIPGGFDATNATTVAATSHFSTGVTVYDSLGNPHTTVIYFTKTTTPVPPATDSVWEWNATVDGSEITGGTAGTLEIEGSGTITFGSDGTFSSATGLTSSDFDFIGAAQSQNITFDFGTATNGTTQFGSASSVGLLSQDGYASGSLQSISIDEEGLITGFFTNGQIQPVALVAVANFQNMDGLKAAGGSLYAETFDSGPPVVTEANTGGAAAIQSNTLEQSNVDLAQEFVKMITTQRGFQANSRTITTTDEMMAEIINIKR